LVFHRVVATPPAHEHPPLTPSGRLALDLAQADATPAVQDLAARFAADWREGLFCLGARRDSLAHLGAARFWAGVAARYLSAVCHLSDTQCDSKAITTSF
jgi:hypothetical protein